MISQRRTCVIPARGGSKRVPRKNVRPFGGKPMIAWSIEAAVASGVFDDVVVSTDDDEIADVARGAGADVPFRRPAHLANDFAGTLEVIQHAIGWLDDNGRRPDVVCCVYATAPFLTARRLVEGLNVLQDRRCSYAFSVVRFDFPVWRAVRMTSAGMLEPVWPEHRTTRSQDLEPLFHDAGQFYWGTADAWRRGDAIFAPTSAPVLLATHEVQDIDTEEDWRRAELMWRVRDA